MTQLDYAVIENKNITEHTKDSVVNLSLQTINELKKQVLIFNNSKRNSQSTAEKIADAIKNPQNPQELKKLSEKILKALSTPTKQCQKLAKIIEKGIAFHHSGLVAKQRTLIENAFKKGLIKLISSTPTLAAGMNLPAYKVIIKDYKRYTQRGFADIPILEYHQMSGRAGRPGQEQIGKAVLCINNSNDLNKVIPKYIYGKPEEIVSKLAVEPTLKMYALSLIAMNMINTKQEIKNFFANTLYATQFQDTNELNRNVFRIIEILKNYSFVEQDDDYYVATRIGKKISELYLNPDTANYFLENIEKIFKIFSSEKTNKFDIYSLIHFIANTVEMKPLFRVSKIEEETYTSKIDNISDLLLTKFDPFEMDYANYLNTLKTTDILIDWIEEAPENYISEKYKITPGELHFKIETIDWLLYSLEELSNLKKNFYIKNFLNKLRIRFKNGIKHDLLPLISLKGIGRTRARKLVKNDIKTLRDIKIAPYEKLERILGTNLAIKIKQQIEQNQDIPQLKQKPREIKVREVTDDEVNTLINTYQQYEKERDEKNMSLTDYF